MELHALHGQGAVAQPHDFAVVGPGRHFKAGGQGFAAHGKRMVAGGPKRIGQAAKHPGVVVMHLRNLAVHQLLGMHHFAAKSLADGLMPEAHAQDGVASCKGLDERHRDAGLLRATGPGRNDDVLRRQRRNLFQGDLVVTPHHHRLPQLTKVLHEVVGEGVIIVDHQQHVCLTRCSMHNNTGTPWCPAMQARRMDHCRPDWPVDKPCSVRAASRCPGE